ncbi:MAG: TonB-dependent receptor [Acidimicrobiia bacterium]|nr:TonB-dependent receptor [Acidimicrobiia bacterium]
MRFTARMWLSLGCLALATLLVSPGRVLAQDSGISGTVTDDTGGVLPGVTVEVSSPALIEGVRTVVTDGTGRYNVTLLRPGTYTVTFTLTGFSVVVREGITLTQGFTAPVNAQLKVGSLEETVTVSGASPTVDVQNVRAQNVMTREVLDALPNAQTLASFSALTLGVVMGGASTQDVAGSAGEQGTTTVHGSRGTDQKFAMDGMNTNNSMGTNGGAFHAGQHYNMEAMQEATMAFSGMTAETETAGVQVNFVPKDGGNNFSGSGRAAYTSGDLQSENITDALRARGAVTPGSIRKIYDYGGAVGGPIKRDRLWFFTAHRWWGDSVDQPGSFFNATQGTRFYTPDTSRPGYLENYNQDNTGRINWQMTQKDKLGYYGNRGDQCVCYLGIGANVAPEAASHNHLPSNHLSQITWNRVQTSRLLIEGGFTYLKNPFAFCHEDRCQEPGTGRQGVDYDDLRYTDLALGRVWGARSSGALPYTDCQGPKPVCDDSEAGQQNGRASVSYVTGSHAFKVGFSAAHGLVEQNGSNNVLAGFGPVDLRLFNGVPNSIQIFAHPKFNRADFRNVGIYGQDQWSLNRFTLNLGARFDMFDGWSPDQSSPDGAFVPGFSVSRIEDTPTWRDVSPRLGLAWDLNGDGKTAVKVSAGRYVAAAGSGTVQPTNPALAIVTSAIRTWSDTNGDFLPQANELGPLSDAAFGSPRVTTFFDPDYLTENREYSWQYSGSFSRELRDNLGASISYYRIQHFDQTVSDNTLVTPSDYDTFCINAPTDSRLPGGGGYQLCNQSMISRARFGQVRTLVRNEKTFGDRKQYFNGVDLEMHGRFPNGALLQGGVALGSEVTDNCVVVDSPDALHFCKTSEPWWNSNSGQLKVSGSFPMPYGIELSGVYQNLAGAQILANVPFTSAQIFQALGRNPAACANASGPCTATVSIPVIEPLTLREDRINQLDFRVAKLLHTGVGRLRLSLDLYNIFNSAAVLARNNTFGGAWGTPTRILGARTIKFNGQYTF